MNINNDEALGLINRLLEGLHQADLTNFGSHLQIVYVASGAQHVENQINCGAYPRPLKPHPLPPSPRGEGEVESAATASHSDHHKGGELPAPEAMAWAVEKTIKDGYWWGNVSWSVVYRIYQMKGYQGTVSQFVRDVSQWPFTMPIRYDCNDDAVGKPIRAGKISRSLDKWAEDGASSQFVILGEALMKTLAHFRK